MIITKLFNYDLCVIYVAVRAIVQVDGNAGF